MPRLRRKRDDVQFCLDANFSIEAALNVRDVVHVSQLPQFRGSRRGQSLASDVDIAQWRCDNGYVLVTQDSDFMSSSMATASSVLALRPPSRASRHRRRARTFGPSCDARCR